jgi:hypothetical protein
MYRHKLFRSNVQSTAERRSHGKEVQTHNAAIYRNPRAGEVGRSRRFFLFFVFALAFSRRKLTAQQTRKTMKASHSTRKTASKTRSP